MSALEHAIDASRRVELAAPRPADETRARVLAAIEARARRRRLTLIAAVTGGALLVAPGAWAAVTGRLGMLSELAHRIGLSVADKPSHERRRAHARVLGAIPVPVTTPVSTLTPAPTLSPSSIAPIHTAAQAATPAAAHAKRAAASRPDSATTVSPLYMEAHRTHFARGDSARALAAWDRYLAAEPHGEFALEARYNRAICLVRLGRTAEALSALGEFARGDAGGYRQHDAQRLIDALRVSEKIR